METISKTQPKIEAFKIGFLSYVEKVKKNPLDIEFLRTQKQQLDKEFLVLKLQLRNTRAFNQIQDFVNAGLAQLVPTEEAESENYYENNLSEGYRVESVPTYGVDEKGRENVLSYNYVKTPVNVDPQQEKTAEVINDKYESDSKKSFYYEQEAREGLLKEKVSAGEMEFVGEMSFDNYIELRKSNKEVNGSNFELIPSFDESKENWTDMRKVYAYLSSPQN